MLPSSNPIQTYLDCAYVNNGEPAGVVANAPADGTITTWRVAGFQGTATLLVFKATADGEFEIVQKSAPETEPCGTVNSERSTT